MQTYLDRDGQSRTLRIDEAAVERVRANLKLDLDAIASEVSGRTLTAILVNDDLLRDVLFELSVPSNAVGRVVVEQREFNRVVRGEPTVEDGMRALAAEMAAWKYRDARRAVNRLALDYPDPPPVAVDQTPDTLNGVGPDCPELRWAVPIRGVFRAVGEQA